MIDPFVAQMLQQMQGTQALQPQFQGAQQGGQQGSNIMGQLGEMFQGYKAPSGPQQPRLSGSPGNSLPYKTQITDMLTPALQQANQQTQQLPTLGALLAQTPGS